MRVRLAQSLRLCGSVSCHGRLALGPAGITPSPSPSPLWATKATTAAAWQLAHKGQARDTAQRTYQVVLCQGPRHVRVHVAVLQGLKARRRLQQAQLPRAYDGDAPARRHSQAPLLAGIVVDKGGRGQREPRGEAQARQRRAPRVPWKHVGSARGSMARARSTQRGWIQAATVHTWTQTRMHPMQGPWLGINGEDRRRAAGQEIRNARPNSHMPAMCCSTPRPC